MNVQGRMTRVITAAAQGDGHGMNQAAKDLVRAHGERGTERAVQFAALTAAQVLRRHQLDVWNPAFGLTADNHPAQLCARRIVAATTNGDEATVDALLEAAATYRYQFRLLLEVAAVAAVVIRTVNTGATK